MRIYCLNKIRALIFISLLFFCTSLFSLVEKIQLKSDLEQCLQTVWGIDPQSVAYISSKFKSLFDNPKNHSVIQDFIKLSRGQNIKFPIDKKIQPLPHDDGIYKSPEEHLIVFENPYIRVLWGSTKPGVREQFHVHEWKSVMVIIKPTTYEIEYPNGSKETITYSIGAFELPAKEKYACTNLGQHADESLRFEIKSQ